MDIKAQKKKLLAQFAPIRSQRAEDSTLDNMAEEEDKVPEGEEAAAPEEEDPAPPEFTITISLQVRPSLQDELS